MYSITLYTNNPRPRRGRGGRGGRGGLGREALGLVIWVVAVYLFSNYAMQFKCVLMRV